MLERTVLVGVSGYATAGKDTLADILVSQFGFVKMAFADPMREMMRAINPIITHGEAFETFTAEDGWPALRAVDEPTPKRYVDILDEIGYTEAKAQYAEVRRLLQALGTQAGREVLGDSIWVDTAMAKARQHPRVVLADMRFKNEARAIQSADGLTIRVNRPGVEAANDHISEHDLDDWAFDEVVENDGSLADLSLVVQDLLRKNFPAIL